MSLCPDRQFNPSEPESPQPSVHASQSKATIQRAVSPHQPPVESSSRPGTSTVEAHDLPVNVPTNRIKFTAIRNYIILYAKRQSSTWYLDHYDEYQDYSTTAMNDINELHGTNVRYFAEYLALMNRPGTWGGDPEIFAIANRYNVQIAVHHATDNTQSILISPRRADNNPLEGRLMLRLTTFTAVNATNTVSYAHYDAIEKRNESSTQLRVKPDVKAPSNLDKRLDELVQMELAADEILNIAPVPVPSSIKSSSEESQVGSSKAEKTRPDEPLPKTGKEDQNVSGRNTPASPAGDADAEDLAMEVDIPGLLEAENEVSLIES
ncbi:hypothetical protein WR25_08878 [Diploscapter pachys]|uniref:OTU domain-containing protein n=1 Tax=Diploscapter pachys TaxID=2018661 RepID=A0A2A2JBB4_9BILA|nr:hypothetical protein WR25_08878 [Diploscapter pachys]